MESPRRPSVDLELGSTSDDGGGGVVTNPRNPFSEPFRSLRSIIMLGVTAFRLLFKFVLDSEKESDTGQICGRFDSHDQATSTAAARPLPQSEEPDSAVEIELQVPYPDSITLEELVSITRDDGLSVLKQFDGASSLPYVSGLSRLLHTDLEKGICGDEDDIRERSNVYGSNTYPLKKEGNFWMFLGEASRGFTLIVLVFVAMASLLLQIKTKTINHGWYDEAGIIGAVILVIFVTAISNYNQSLLFEKLNDEKRKILIEVFAHTIKNFHDHMICYASLNFAEYHWKQVPADGVLVSGFSLQIAEYESMGTSRVRKDTDTDPILLSGSKVEDGIGTMLVTSVGMNTQWRMPMASIPLYTGKETPLQVYLNRVVTVFGLVSISVALVVSLIVSFLYFMGRTKNKDGSPMFVAGKTTLDEAIDMVIKFIILGVTIVVAAVPEGLPLAVTLNIAHMSRKLGGEKALVQKLSACEAMGSATTVMEVVDVCAGGVLTQNLDTMAELSPLLISLITEGIALNTNGSVYHSEGRPEPEVFGSATERAILKFGVKLGMNFDEVKSKSTIFRVWPFNSSRKCRGVAVQLHDSQSRVHWKGAAKTILASCQWYMDMDNIASMDQEKLFHFEKTIDDMANKGLRCAALAYRTYPEEDIHRNEAFPYIPESNLVLLAIIGIKDSCRPGIRQAIQQCRNAGVKMCMVTGDDLLTAKAIATECGILRATSDETADTAILAKDFASMSEAQREKIAENIVVMGRSSPDENLLLIEALSKKGHVVAATGKGIRDAPSLRQADVSLAMGIGGTSIIKECSDIIVLDDSFDSILTVIQWGRSLYTNVQRFVQFRLTVSASALIICVVVAIHSHEIPLNVAQLLWINLLIDTFGAWALASEPPSDNLMRRPPLIKGEPFITKLMWAKFFLQVAYQVTALLVLHFYGESILKLENKSLDCAKIVKNTVIFNSFVFCQVISLTSLYDLSTPSCIYLVRASRLLAFRSEFLQVIVIECLGIFISAVRLDWKQWLISIGIGFFSQVAGRFPFQPFPYLRN
ncbi:hypothetical protein Bca4012_023092 [Brassica carinata]